MEARHGFGDAAAKVGTCFATLCHVSREVDLGQDRPTQRVSAKSVDPNATPMVYFLMQTLLKYLVLSQSLWGKFR